MTSWPEWSECNKQASLIGLSSLVTSEQKFHTIRRSILPNHRHATFLLSTIMAQHAQCTMHTIHHPPATSAACRKFGKVDPGTGKNRSTKSTPFMSCLRPQFLVPFTSSVLRYLIYKVLFLSSTSIQSTLPLSNNKVQYSISNFNQILATVQQH